MRSISVPCGTRSTSSSPPIICFWVSGFRKFSAFVFDYRCFSKTIQHDVAANFGKRSRDAETDAARRTRHNCGFSLQH
jgi:hypothetical protein